MIVMLLISAVVFFINLLTAPLPTVVTLPIIAGYDIDSTLVSGMGMFYTFAGALWPLLIVFQGFLVLLSYYSLKMVLKFFLGHRAPGTH